MRILSKSSVAFFIFVVLFIFLACSPPSPKRVVQMYLEDFCSASSRGKNLDQYMTEKYRQEFKKISFIPETQAADENYFNIFSPLIKLEDAELIYKEYDFKISYLEQIAVKSAVVRVDLKILPKPNLKDPKALESETLRDDLKNILKDKPKLQFLFRMKKHDENWKIDKVIYPELLARIIMGKIEATVVIPSGDDGTVEDMDSESPAPDPGG